MFDLQKLTDLGQSFVTYILFAALACVAGRFIANFGPWTWDGFDAIGGLLLAPGHALAVLGFLAAALAGANLPNKVRVASLVGGAILMTKYLGAGGWLFRLV